jgi:transposase-like protein
MPLSATIRTVRHAALELKRMDYRGEGWDLLRDAGRKTLKRVLEQHMEVTRRTYLEKLEEQGFEDRCNGYYSRHLLTSMGDIELSVPRTRTFSAAGALRAYARREDCVDRMILACFVLGLSTRKVGTALLPILGERVSASTVSRIAKTLDEAVASFHRRPIQDKYRILILDGVVLARKTGAGAIRHPVLVAMGITPEGKKEILDFRLSSSESEHDWETFLTSLYNRGLKGKGLELVVTDGGKGLINALQTVFPDIPMQRCWAHKTRNITDKVKRTDRERVKRDIRLIYNAETIRQARGAARRFANRWQDRYPKAVACLRYDLDELLQFLKLGDPDWYKTSRTTNAIERRFREVRRRTRPMGVFSDRTSVERILYAVFTHENLKEETTAPFPLTQNN